MELDELLAIVADLRGEGSAIAEVEVKRASGAFPASIGPTLSAFANLPGGGTVIFGPDENDDFRACTSALASLARNGLEPPLNPQTGDFEVQGRPIVVARIEELPASPQRFFPNLVIQAAVAPGPGDPPGTSAVDARRLRPPAVDGGPGPSPGPAQHQNRVRFGRDGHGRDEPEYPVAAVREPLSTALIHRDLGPYARGEAITLRIENSQLVSATSAACGGLSADRLGQTGVTRWP